MYYAPNLKLFLLMLPDLSVFENSHSPNKKGGKERESSISLFYDIGLLLHPF